MTTKAKPRTAPAAEPAVREDLAVMRIPRLIARLHFLEADRKYRAATGAPDDLGGQCAAILHLLSKIEPDNFDDGLALLDFATKRLRTLTARGRYVPDSGVTDMLKNAWCGLYKAQITQRLNSGLRLFEAQDRADYEAM